LRVLDEIGSRLNVIETIRRLADDPQTDELHTLHPLILRARWLFGHEFDSEEYCSNAQLQTVAHELFNKKEANFINEKNRPDIVVLADKTSIQLTGIESFNPIDSALTHMSSILLIELKKGGFKLSRNEVSQAEGYLQDIYSSGVLTGQTFICVWVVGQNIAPGVARDKTLKDDNGREYGRVRATTFATLVDTANRRLLKLRDSLADRYGNLSTDALLNKVFAQPVQVKMSL